MSALTTLKKNGQFDKDIYTITIRKETVDGDVYYVGRVAEFMNVTAYEDSYDDALAIICNSLCEIAAQARQMQQTTHQTFQGAITC